MIVTQNYCVSNLIEIFDILLTGEILYIKMGEEVPYIKIQFYKKFIPPNQDFELKAFTGFKQQFNTTLLSILGTGYPVLVEAYKGKYKGYFWITAQDNILNIENKEDIKVEENEKEKLSFEEEIKLLLYSISESLECIKNDLHKKM